MEREQVMNGPEYIPEFKEYAIWVDGECIGWASDCSTAQRIYHEALATRREHVTRNPANRLDDIPFDVSYTSDDSVTGPQDCGL